jgi:hypothetical protein
MNRVFCRALLLASIASWAGRVCAQEPAAEAKKPAAPAAAPSDGPRGPAEIIQQTTRGRDRAEVERAAQAGESAAKQAEKQAEAAGKVPAGDALPGREEAAEPALPAGAAPPGTNPHEARADAAQPSAEPAPDLPHGTIEISVLAPNGRPDPGAQIVLGIMASQGGRSEKHEKTGPNGQFTFRDLATGSSQAYRVNVLADGAKFSCMPFRLPDAGGYRVRIPRLPTTKDPRMVFQLIGQTVVELRDDRLHITQQARVGNAGQEIFVLPEDGMLVPLPAGFTAFQWQDQMTDQHGEEAAEKGFRMKGSVPPGTVTLAWSFDLPRTGESAKIPVDLPWKTYSYRVISEAPQGLSLRVSDFPEAEKVKDEGRDLLFTQLKRSPMEEEIASFSIRIDGIPGPGPGRWIAAVLAFLLAGYGLIRAFRFGESEEGRRGVIAERKRALLDAGKQLEAERARGDVGPEYHARRLDEITTQLALILRDEEALAPSAASAPR